MKKMFFAAAAVAAVFAVTGANAQKIEKECSCGQLPVQLKADKRDIHMAYVAGDVDFDIIRTGMEDVGYNWAVNKKKKSETWSAGNPMGQDVYVKMKEGKTSKKVKAHTGKERMFAKDLNSGNGKRHVAKIYEGGERYVVSGISSENGCQVIAEAKAKEAQKKAPKEEKEKAKKEKKEEKKNK